MELIDFSSLFIQTINIAIVIFVLQRFLFHPYLAFLDAETVKRKKLESDMADSKKIVDDAKNKATELLDTSRMEAKALADTIVDNARKNAEDITAAAMNDAEILRKQGMADIDHERKLLENEMQKRVVTVALKMNQKLFGKQASAHEDFLKNISKNTSI